MASQEELLIEIATLKTAQAATADLLDVSERMFGMRSADDLVRALLHPLEGSGVFLIELLYIDLNGAGEPLWIEDVANWQRSGAPLTRIGTRQYLDSYPFAHLWRQGASNTLFVSDARTDPRFQPTSEHPLVNWLNMGAMVFVLLSVAERWIGVVTFKWQEARPFSDHERAFFSGLPRLVAPAVDSLRIVTAAERMCRQRIDVLQQQVEDLDLFSKTVAHDLKNPLSSTIFTANMLEHYLDRMSEDRLRRALRRISENGHRMSQIIDSLLMLATVGGLGDVEITVVDMTRLIAHVQQRQASLIARRQASITFASPPDTWPAIDSYAPWIEEVWANLISNAIKHGGRPPVVTLGAEPYDARRVRFWVRDNGPGIPVDQQGSIFEPFVRLSDRHSEGHGLGLWIVERIMIKLGGELAVENGAEGGAIFSFILPVSPGAR